MVDIVVRLRSVPPNSIGARFGRARALDGELVAVIAVLGVALTIGLLTAGDYGLSVDEFNTDDYGPKALAWYTSGFAIVRISRRSSNICGCTGPGSRYSPHSSSRCISPTRSPRATRVTFVVGLVGLAAVVPIARLTIGRWAGLAALVALSSDRISLRQPVLHSDRRALPVRHELVDAGDHHDGAPARAGLERHRRDRPSHRARHRDAHGWDHHARLSCRRHEPERPCRPSCTIAAARVVILTALALRTASVVVIAWVTAIALWPWLQIGNPLAQFADAYAHFASLDTSFEFLNWGRDTLTDQVPWWYIPGQLLVRLPEGFLLLLLAGIGFGLAAAVAPLRAVIGGVRRDDKAGTPRSCHPSRAIAPEPGRRRRGVRSDRLSHRAGFDPLRRRPPRAVHAADARRRRRRAAWRRPCRCFAALRSCPRLIGGLHAAGLLATLVILHPLEYVAMNASPAAPPAPMADSSSTTGASLFPKRCAGWNGGSTPTIPDASCDRRRACWSASAGASTLLASCSAATGWSRPSRTRPTI